MSEDVNSNRTYIAIDLKSFYASVECVDRGLAPLTTNLVVADESRTEKTICLAVSPSLKKYGIPGRARLFEVIQKCKEIKASTGQDIEYIVAPPRMQRYVDCSTDIYQIYLKYISPEDIHVYSIDEVFMDITNYMHLYVDDEGRPLSAHDLAMLIIKDVLKTTGITATAGIGTNLYLAKIAMDIVAKHMDADKDGVRIAELDEISFRKKLWNHKPLTDFWRIGKGISNRLAKNGMFTMGDIARVSMSKVGYLTGEEFLYKIFGIDAEFIIDHAWGIEPCTIADIKKYKPSTNSITSGQVLTCGYSFDKGRTIVKEMTELLVLSLVEKKLVTNSVTLDVGYDREFDVDKYRGDIVIDGYGRTVPKPVHGSYRLEEHTSSTEQLMRAILNIYDRIVDAKLLIRRVTISFCNTISEDKARQDKYVQIDLFTNYEKLEKERIKRNRERRMQEAVLSIQSRYGKNAILKGTNFEEGATTIERNQQIGGHRA